jgi:hypothetical protein
LVGPRIPATSRNFLRFFATLVSLSWVGVVTPNPALLNKIIDLLQIDIRVSPGDKAALQASIVGPKGELTLTS